MDYELAKIYQEIKEQPLRYDDGFIEPSDVESYIEGQAHFKQHCLDIIKDKLNYSGKLKHDTIS